MSLIKRYHPNINCKKVNKQLYLMRILSLLSFAVMVLFIVRKSSTTHILFLFLLGVAFLWLDIIWFVQKLAGGYSVLNDSILYWWHYKRHELKFQDIHRIYVVNASWNNGDLIDLPYILIIGGEDHHVLQYCMSDIENGPLLNTELESILIQNKETENNYGFLWNDNEMQKLFVGYQGEYYIADSIISRCSKEYDLICTQYGLKDRIHIIYDTKNELQKET